MVELIKMMNIRGDTKRSIIAAMTAPPPPEVKAVQDAQTQLTLQQLQAQINELNTRAEANAAKAQEHMANIQKLLAEAQIGIPAEAQRDIDQGKKLKSEGALLRTEAIAVPEKIKLEQEKNDNAAVAQSNKALEGAAKTVARKTKSPVRASRPKPRPPRRDQRNEEHARPPARSCNSFELWCRSPSGHGA
jgi:hypothetical protein